MNGALLLTLAKCSNPLRFREENLGRAKMKKRLKLKTLGWGIEKAC